MGFITNLLCPIRALHSTQTKRNNNVFFITFNTFISISNGLIVQISNDYSY